MHLSKSILLLCLFTSPLFAQQDIPWTLVKSKDSIDVYTRLSPASKYKSIKVLSTFKCPLSTVMALLQDASSYYKWINTCKESRLLKFAGDSVIVFYERYDLPWPASDRDVIIETKIKYNADKTSVTLSPRGHATYLPEKEDVVRVPEFTGSWKLTSQADGSTKSEYIASVNLGGYIPAFLVNMFITNGPYDSIVNMKKLLETK